MLIYIIRHGETDLNVKGIMQGRLDEPLNENGRLLASITGKSLRDIRFDSCISSPLKRAAETARIILRESDNSVPVLYDKRLEELSFGKYEGKKLTKEEAAVFFSNPFQFGKFPGGESVYDVCKRTQEFLKELISKDDNKTYLVSTHGCALRAMLNWLYRNPDDYWHGNVPYNCVVNILKSQNGVSELIADDIILYDRKYCVDRYR